MRRGSARIAALRLRRRAKKLLQPLLPILENSFDITANKEPVNQCPASWAIADAIQTERASVALLESMGVMPQCVGAAQLQVHESMRRIPFGDFCSPADGQAMHPNPVVNERAGPHCDGRGRQHLKL